MKLVHFILFFILYLLILHIFKLDFHQNFKNFENRFIEFNYFFLFNCYLAKIKYHLNAVYIPFLIANEIYFSRIQRSYSFLYLNLNHKNHMTLTLIIYVLNLKNLLNLHLYYFLKSFL